MSVVRSSIVSVLILTGCLSAHFETSTKPAPIIPEATVPLTEVRTLRSSILGRSYTIFVALPASYSSEASQTYPVVYLLDADLWFGPVADPTRLLHWEGGLPELIIVGIGYGFSWEDVDEWFRRRTLDFTPTRVEAKPDSGGARDFLRFVQEELFPFVDANYRTIPTDRTLAGLSAGGLFSLYVLFQDPGTFSRYIVVSPGLVWDERVIFENEADYAARNTDLPARLFLAVGSLERKCASNLEDFHRQLEARNYTGLTVTMVVMEEETHLSVFPGAFSRGLRTIFK
jgi:hypothetical protein